MVAATSFPESLTRVQNSDPATLEAERHPDAGSLLGAKFFILLVKRILAWERARTWTDEDACEAVGLHAFARPSHGTTLVAGYDAHERAAQECYRARSRERMVAEWERLRRKT